MKLETLKRRAMKAAKERDHEMLPRFTGGQYRASNHCKLCGMTVSVNTKPAPNEIEIHGEAVAKLCAAKHQNSNVRF